MATTYYAKYVLINTGTGTIHWYENHDTAIREQISLGGVVYNTDTCAPQLLENALLEARRHMDTE